MCSRWLHLNSALTHPLRIWKGTSLTHQTQLALGIDGGRFSPLITVSSHHFNSHIGNHYPTSTSFETHFQLLLPSLQIKLLVRKSFNTGVPVPVSTKINRAGVQGQDTGIVKATERFGLSWILISSYYTPVGPNAHNRSASHLQSAAQLLDIMFSSNWPVEMMT